MRVEVDPERVRQVFSRFSGSPAFAESGALLDRGEAPVEMLQALSLRPEILQVLGQMGEGVYPGGILDRPLKEKVILKASILNGCQFCADSHRAVMRMIGIPEPQIEELEAPANLSQREELALQYTQAMMQDSNRIDDALFARLKQVFSDEEIVELSFLIGYINLLNLFNNALQVSYRGEYGG